MNLSTIAELTEAKIICGQNSMDERIEFAFASDLMSDVLTLDTDRLLLITGLCNTQTIRTAEMSDVKYILIVRGKQPTDEMIELASQNSIALMQTAYSLFHTAGVLYQSGLKPIY